MLLEPRAEQDAEPVQLHEYSQLLDRCWLRGDHSGCSSCFLLAIFKWTRNRHPTAPKTHTHKNQTFFFFFLTKWVKNTSENTSAVVRMQIPSKKYIIISKNSLCYNSRDGTGKYPTGQPELWQKQKPVRMSKQNPLITVMEMSVWTVREWEGIPAKSHQDRDAHHSRCWWVAASQRADRLPHKAGFGYTRRTAQSRTGLHAVVKCCLSRTLAQSFFV